MDPLSSPRFEPQTQKSSEPQEPGTLKKPAESVDLKNPKGILEDILSRGQLSIIVAQLSNQLDLGPSSAATTQAAQGHSSPTIDPELIESLAIAHKAGGNKEIRVQLKNSALEGTELFISRNADGLNMRFVTTSAQSNKVLEENLSAMQAALKQRLPGEKLNLEVRYSSNSKEFDDEDPDYFISKT